MASPSGPAIPPDLSRYHRQIILPGFGVEGQRRLTSSHAAIIGCGALGSVVADSLARAGVGTLTIVDRDLVDRTNLQRQVLFDEDDARASRPKAEAAAARLSRVNPEITIHAVAADLNPRNAESITAAASVLIDGTDNFQTRYLLNDLAVKRGVPLVYGGVVGTAGMTMTIVPVSASAPTPPTPCLRCIFPDPPAPGSSPTCDTAGVLGPMAGVVALIQAAEAIKVLLGRFDLLRPALSEFDIWNNHRRTIDLAAFSREGCPCCGQRRFEFLEAPFDLAAALCGTDSVQIHAPTPASIDLAAFAETMRRAGFADFAASRFMARGGVDGLVLTLFADGRAIIKGTTDFSRARSIYARCIGS